MSYTIADLKPGQKIKYKLQSETSVRSGEIEFLVPKSWPGGEYKMLVEQGWTVRMKGGGLIRPDMIKEILN